MAIDDHARIAFTAVHREEKKHEAVAFVHNAVAYYARLGVRIKYLLADNCAAFRYKEFAAACKALGAQHKFTRSYRPQTNGKAERRIQSALRWTYGPMPWRAGSPITTGTGHTAALVTSLRSPKSNLKITY